MRTLGRRVPIAFLLMLVMATPGQARVARIETTAPVADESEAAVDLALTKAVDACIDAAVAMGLSWIRVQRAVLQEDRVILQMVGADDDEEGEDTGLPAQGAPALRSL